MTRAPSYHGGVCARDGTTLKYVSTQGCIACSSFLRERWRQNNPEKTRAYSRNYYANNTAKVSARAKGYRAADPERARRNHVAWTSKAFGRASRLLSGARHRAKSKGMDFSLTTEWLLPRVEKGICECTGLPLVFGYGKFAPFSPSLDRIDSSKGYTPDNCRLIIWALNMAFGKWGERAFEQVARAWLERKQ